MMNRLIAVFALTLITVACGAQEPEQVDTAPFHIEPAFPHLHFHRPLYLTHAPDRSEHLYVLEQDGVVHVLANDPDITSTRIALDIREQVRRRNNEEGLLGLAFHPDYKTNRQLFLCYSASDPRRDVVSRWTMGENGQVIDPDSEVVILEVEQPWGNHNGGMIEFGPDGYLYISFGDGGSGGDPLNSGQDLSTLLGAILRIDVDQQADGLAYAIPEDNPFVSQQGARGEIWAYGLRNVWRFSFDRETGTLWAGDVGQNKWEEIDIIVKGGNYGWNWREGMHWFRTPPSGAEPGPFVEPIVEHGRQKSWSITGGYVYRGHAIPDLQGAYVYGDFGSGRIWTLRYDGRRVSEHHEAGHLPLIASFGEDRAGELYICSFDGRIYKLVPASAAR